MITGTVTDDREAVIILTLRGPSGDEQEFEAVIDTGFDGSLTAPPGVIAALGLPLRRRGRATVFDIYEATVMWDGNARRVSVDEVDVAPLLGMSLLYGYELTVQIVEGGSVFLEPLP